MKPTPIPSVRYPAHQAVSCSRLNHHLRIFAPGGRIAPESLPPAFQIGAGVDVYRVLEISEECSFGLAADMEYCREQGLLTRFLGGRSNALLRPLPAPRIRLVRRKCPYLVSLIDYIEAILDPRDLFIWGLKLDRAAASTTHHGSDVTSRNPHFDAGMDSFAENRRPIPQFILNIGQRPRQLFISPLQADEILLRLHEDGVLHMDVASTYPASKLLDLYRKRYELPLEIATIPSGYLAVFDGRRHPHDGAKLDVDALYRGHIVPAAEPDLVVLLDYIENGLLDTRCNPRKSFLRDSHRKELKRKDRVAVARQHSPSDEPRSL